MAPHHTSNRKPTLLFSSNQSKCTEFPIFRTGLAVLVLVFVGCQGQTFQYSRGWTNGKRSGYPLGNGGPETGVAGGQPPFENENGGVVSVPAAEDPIQPSGTIRIRATTGPQGRLRSADYAQYLNKKFTSGGSGTNRKSPVWILGVDQESGPGNAEF